MDSTQIIAAIVGSTVGLEVIKLCFGSIGSFFTSRTAAKRDALAHEVERERLEREAEKQRTEAELNTFQAVLAPLERRLEKSEKRCDELQTALDKTRQELYDERTKRQNNESQLNDLRGKVAALQEALGKKDIEIAALYSERAGLQAEITKLTARVRELETNAANAITRENGF